jgi:hypothetical protein
MASIQSNRGHRGTPRGKGIDLWGLQECQWRGGFSSRLGGRYRAVGRADGGSAW